MLLFVVTYNYFAAHALRRARPAWQTFWVALSVVVDLGILAYFKYAYFIADFLNDLFGLSIQVHDVLGELMNGITGTTACHYPPRGHLLLHFPGRELHHGREAGKD